LSAELFVGFLVAVNCCYLGETYKVLGSLFVCGLEVLAVAAPGSVEFDNLEG
jgi:hypothetical protein